MQMYGSDGGTLIVSNSLPERLHFIFILAVDALVNDNCNTFILTHKGL